MIVAYIDGHKTRFGVEPICRVLSAHGMQIAPSTYYAAVKNPVSASDLADAYLVNELVCLFRANRSVYGARKCWHAMRRAGHQVGRDQVGRLMRIAGITDALLEAGIAGSIGTVGDALDNALMESTIGLYKTELIDWHDRTWTGRSEVERETASWVHWFNTTRLHSSIGYTSPIEYEQQYREPTTQTASITEVA